jgi:hypothetical protein
MSVISAQRFAKFATHEDTEEDTITVRPSSTALFCVDSEDRYRTYDQRRTAITFPFTMSIVRNQSLLNGFFKRVALTEFRMYWTLPNIHEAWGNNTLTYNTGGTAYTITIPNGFYELESLMATIQDLIRTNSPGGIATFTATPQVDGTSTYSGGGTAFFFPKPTVDRKTLFDMLNLFDTTTATSGTQGGVANLRSTDYIDIVCSQLTYNQKLKDGSSAVFNRDIVERIYLDDTTKSLGRYNTNLFDASGNPAGFQAPQYDITDFTNGCTPFTIYRQFSLPKQIRWEDVQPLGNLTFELYDDQGRSLQALWTAVYPTTTTAASTFYANSFQWNMSLLISEN